MNRPRITKQTLKQLRGDLCMEQSQKQTSKSNENDDAVSPAVERADEMDVRLTQEEEDNMSM